jgi:uncharacterized protein with PhoU and TrkA domain
MEKINFDDLLIEEKIKVINESAARFAEAMQPIVARMVKAFQELSKAAAHIADSVFTDEFKNKYMRELKKERHRKSYQRMVARRK